MSEIGTVLFEVVGLVALGYFLWRVKSVPDTIGEIWGRLHTIEATKTDLLEKKLVDAGLLELEEVVERRNTIEQQLQEEVDNAIVKE